MSKRTNPTLIGAFVLGGLALLAAALVALGGGILFRESVTYVAYFDGSITGLRAGAPVRFRGAPVGTVTDIRLELLEPSGQILLPVTFELNKNSLHKSGATPSADETHDFVQVLIRRGLRASLALESIVTGQLYVELDFAPDTPIRKHDAYSEHPEFPTTRSPLQKISETLKRLPIDELAGSVRNSLEGLSAFFNSPDLRDAIKSFDDLTHQAVKTLNKIDAQLEPLTNDLRTTTAESRRTLEAARAAIESFSKAVAEGSPLRYKLITSLDNVSDAARALRAFADYMQQHPEAFVFGKDKERR